MTKTKVKKKTASRRRNDVLKAKRAAKVKPMTRVEIYTLLNQFERVKGSIKYLIYINDIEHGVTKSWRDNTADSQYAVVTEFFDNIDDLKRGADRLLAAIKARP